MEVKEFPRQQSRIWEITANLHMWPANVCMSVVWGISQSDSVQNTNLSPATVGNDAISLTVSPAEIRQLKDSTSGSFMINSTLQTGATGL